MRKEISSSTSYEAQRRESDLLLLLKRLNNVNIVRLVTSYTQNGFCSLLFPAADYDLSNMLLNPVQPEWAKNPEQVVDSLRGLANGIHHLHQYCPVSKPSEQADRIAKHGYHHDIKPSNVLVKGTRLILADFGLSRLKDVNEATKTIWKNASPTYGAPEAYDPVTLQERRIGQAYDIWSFGCVLSEFATYALEGAAGVKTFRKAREQEGTEGNNNCFHNDGEVSAPVMEWVREMNDLHRSSPLLTLFQLSMKCLVGNPDKRQKSKQVVQNLERASLTLGLRSLLDKLFMMEVEAGRQGLSTEYLAKLTLERNRLQAWGYALGLKLIEQQEQAWTHGHMYELIHNHLKNCAERLAEFVEQNNEPDIEERVSALLKSTNDSLVRDLDQSVTITIENTLKFLMALTGKPVQGPVDCDEDSMTLNPMDRATAQDQSTSQDREAGLLAAARYKSRMLTSDITLASEGAVKTIHPDLLVCRIPNLTYFTPLSVYWFASGRKGMGMQKVLIEEAPYFGTWTSMSDSEEFSDTGKEVLGRVAALAKLFQMQPKPKDMRLLKYLGLVHAPDSAGLSFVYELPHEEEVLKPPSLIYGEDNGLEPLSLSDFIRNTEIAEHNPTLNDKFALSLAITSCIHSLHLTGWFHKSIRSSNFIYFNKKGGDLSQVKLSEPYLIGFERSRQSTPMAHSNKGVETKERAFTHRTYLQGEARFHPAFDYYSLGVILLEIATWRPVEEILSGVKEALWRGFLLKHATTYVPPRMGTSYCGAVIACLNFYKNHRGEKEGSLLMKFQQEVLEKLQRGGLPS